MEKRKLHSCGVQMWDTSGWVIGSRWSLGDALFQMCRAASDSVHYQLFISNDNIAILKDIVSKDLMRAYALT